MEWVACTLRAISQHGVYSITNSDAHTSAASSRLNWRPRWFKWTRPFCRKKKSGFCACAITFQTRSTYPIRLLHTAKRHLSCARGIKTIVAYSWNPIKIFYSEFWNVWMDVKRLYFTKFSLIRTQLNKWTDESYVCFGVLNFSSSVTLLIQTICKEFYFVSDFVYLDGI